MSLKRAITPGIKMKFDQIIFDIGVFMFFQESFIPEVECTWHPLEQVHQAGPIPGDMIAQIHGLRTSTILNGVLGRVVGRVSSRQGRPCRWQFLLDDPGFALGRYAGGVEVLSVNISLMTHDKRASSIYGAMWLYALDEFVTPSELFFKLLQHHDLYTPCVGDGNNFSYKRPFIQQLGDILRPWEEAISDGNLARLDLSQGGG